MDDLWISVDRVAKVLQGELQWQARHGESVLWRTCRLRANGRAAGTAASTAAESAVQRLSGRRFAVRKNFSNCRCKIIDTGTGHDDAVTAAVSFLGDTQESPALIFPELDVEMLAFDLQFSRLDDVIHFALRARV